MIDQVDYQGRTALSWAAELGDTDTIQRLLVKGADPNIADARGATPLMYCACASDTRCLIQLLEAGANVDDIDHEGYTKLRRVISMKDDVKCVKILWEWGANLNSQNNWKWGAELNYQNKGVSPIASAVGRSRPDTLKWLLEHGADLEARLANRETTILKLLASTFDDRSGMLETLLEKKPNLLAENDFHEGILHHIARYNGLRTINAFQQEENILHLDTDRRSSSGLKLWSKSIPGKTARELAQWRRDCQSEWSLECATPLDSDPQAWFAAFEALIESINAARRMNTQSSHDASGATTISTSIDSGNPQIHLRLPGTYPQE